MHHVNVNYRLPARYYDPVTQLPFASLQAFRILREAYYQQLEAKGDASAPEVGRWIEWRKKYRQARAAALAAARADKAATTTTTTGTAPQKSDAKTT